MRISKKTFFTAVAAAAIGATAIMSAPASAEDFPSETIKFVVPYSAGGGQDRWARVLASTAFDHFGQGMHVQVRAGAGGSVGWNYLKHLPADGHTIMIGSLSPMISVMTEPNSPIKIDDIKVVCVVSDFNVHMMSLPNSEFDTWEKLVEYAKANPGKLTVGGTLAQTLGAAAVFSQAKIDVTIVPYPGTSKAVADLLGGHISLAVVTPATTVSLGDKAVPVINIGARPDSEAFVKQYGKKIAWVGDYGYKGLSQPRWIGVRPDTPDDRIARLAAGFKATVADKSVKRLVSNLGEEIIFSDTAEANQMFQDLVEAIDKHAKLIK